MKILKSKYRSSLTDKHLNDYMRVAITKYTANYNKLAVEIVSSIALNSITLFRWTVFLIKHYIHSYCILLNITK
jgi:hypothetical protein